MRQLRATCRLALLSLLGAVGGLASQAKAQLAPDQVLLVYHSGLPESRDVARLYAGSRAVPGSAPGAAGARPGVFVLDLATVGVPVPASSTMTPAQFRTMRTAIAGALTSRNLTSRVRCIVLTKGIPHRIEDSTSPNAGENTTGNPGSIQSEYFRNDATCASVDSELTRVYQDQFATENGLGSDSLADGVIVNPYWRQPRALSTFTNVNVALPKTLEADGTGPQWKAGTVAGTARLNIGDVMLVVRLDAPQVSHVQDMLTRARGLFINTDTATILFDEDGQNLDNSSSAFPLLSGGDDYTLARQALVTDRRFSFTFPSDPPNVRLDDQAGVTNFFVGPRLAWTAGQGVLVTTPVLLVASYGANHQGVPTLQNGSAGGPDYATSFVPAPGAIFNTVESYNGRVFGTVTGNFGQAQASGFLAAGGTFALGNVWEPFADSIPDNEQLVKNFVLGNLSWGEAAWGSIPALSWMQVVLGDPLARAARSNEDIDADARVRTDDLYAWQTAGPAAVRSRDVNRSGTIDAADRALIAATVRANERVTLLNNR